MGNSQAGTDDEQSLNTNCDQDSDTSFMNGTDEETATADIEEEDLIDDITRSTEEAIDQMKTARIQWLDQNTQKNEME